MEIHPISQHHDILLFQRAVFSTLQHTGTHPFNQGDESKMAGIGSEGISLKQ